MAINLIDARRGLHDKCLELFADKKIAEQIYRYLCDGIEECEEAKPVKHGAIELTYEEYAELCSYALADEQNHGEWRIDKSGGLMCSKCGTLLDEGQKPSRFCPNCGADMRGRKNE